MVYAKSARGKEIIAAANASCLDHIRARSLLDDLAALKAPDPIIVLAEDDPNFIDLVNHPLCIYNAVIFRVHGRHSLNPFTYHSGTQTKHESNPKPNQAKQATYMGRTGIATAGR